jgi:hypothetical protein
MKWQELSSTSHYQTAMAIKRVLQGGDVQEAITGIEEISYHPHSGWFEDAPYKGAETRDGPLGAIPANLPSIVSMFTSP